MLPQAFNFVAQRCVDKALKVVRKDASICYNSFVWHAAYTHSNATHTANTATKPGKCASDSRPSIK